VRFEVQFDFIISLGILGLQIEGDVGLAIGLWAGGVLEG
jgi:hypothetical protein